MCAFSAPGEPASRPVVLVVEDHQDSRAMYVEFLRVFYQVEEAADATEALETARRRPPDVVVTDLSLPGRDGLELLEALQREGFTGGAICLSGYNSPQHAQRAREVGCETLLVKPCLPDTLRAEIESALKKRA
jgi:two-component system KDP operon response regulator KdpE